jgi:hypothetical protein
MKLIEIRWTPHQGRPLEKLVDRRVWAAYQRTTRGTSHTSKWHDDAGYGSMTLRDMHDGQDCEAVNSPIA